MRSINTFLFSGLLMATCMASAVADVIPTSTCTASLEADSPKSGYTTTQGHSVTIPIKGVFTMRYENPNPILSTVPFWPALYLTLSFGYSGLTQLAAEDRVLSVEVTLAGGEFVEFPDLNPPITLSVSKNAGFGQFVAQAAIDAYALNHDKTAGYVNSHSSNTAARSVSVHP